MSSALPWLLQSQSQRDFQVSEFPHQIVQFVDSDWGLVEVIRMSGSQKGPVVVKASTEDATLAGCNRYCLYPSDFRCRNLPCFHRLTNQPT